MASVIKRTVSRGIGVSDVSVYTVPANTVAVLIGLNIANILDTSINVDIKYRVDSNDVYVLKGITIPPNASFTPTGMEQKLTMAAADQLVIKSDTAASADVILSYSEITNS